MPQARPSATEKNSPVISFALPGTLRKRTSAKVPATASPAPMLPLTSMIISVTTGGSIASDSVSEPVWWPCAVKTSAVSTPSASDEKMQIRKLCKVMLSVMTLLSNCDHSIEIFLYKPGLIAAAVL